VRSRSEKARPDCSWPRHLPARAVFKAAAHLTVLVWSHVADRAPHHLPPPARDAPLCRDGLLVHFKINQSMRTPAPILTLRSARIRASKSAPPPLTWSLTAFPNRTDQTSNRVSRARQPSARARASPAATNRRCTACATPRRWSESRKRSQARQSSALTVPGPSTPIRCCE
jgi:hypothetical protein